VGEPRATTGPEGRFSRSLGCPKEAVRTFTSMMSFSARTGRSVTTPARCVLEGRGERKASEVCVWLGFEPSVVVEEGRKRLPSTGMQTISQACARHRETLMSGVWCWLAPPPPPPPPPPPSHPAPLPGPPAPGRLQFLRCPSLWVFRTRPTSSRSFSTSLTCIDTPNRSSGQAGCAARVQVACCQSVLNNAFHHSPRKRNITSIGGSKQRHIMQAWAVPTPPRW